MKLRMILKESAVKPLTISDANTISSTLEPTDTALTDWMRISGRDPNHYDVSLYLAVWDIIRNKIIKNEFKLTEPLDPPPTTHEIKVGGIKRNGRRTPIIVQGNKVEFDDNLWDMLMVGYFLKERKFDDFSTMSTYAIGSITHIDDKKVTWVVNHWYPDFEYLDKIRIAGIPKYSE